MFPDPIRPDPIRFIVSYAESAVARRCLAPATIPLKFYLVWKYFDLRGGTEKCE
jgi:hypothetical protein